MFRFDEQNIKKWYQEERRKPLILRGARQVGKTELIRAFAASEHLKLAEINLEKYLYLDKIFKSLDVDIILKELESITHILLSQPDALLFLDEIQATPHALQALRYLFEEKPGLAVIAAGSLLEFTLKDHNYSMPVGRIKYFHLGPFTFKEFLLQVEPALAEVLENFHVDTPLTLTHHTQLLKRQREYLFVGGMPEAVLIFSTTGSLTEAARIHESIIRTYYDDFSKYAKAKDLMLLQQLFTSLPRMTGSKVVYTRFAHDARSVEIKHSLDLLVKARLCFPVHHSHCDGLPLGAGTRTDPGTFKLLFLDSGLANHQSGIDWMTLSAYDNVKLVNEGRMAEQFIGQHLLYRDGCGRQPELFYWLREGKQNNAEVDYVISRGDWIVPVEVKAGEKGSMKSLFQFFARIKSRLAVRFDLNPPSLMQAEHRVADADATRTVAFPLLSLPCYLVEETGRLIDEMRATYKE